MRDRTHRYGLPPALNLLALVAWICAGLLPGSPGTVNAQGTNTPIGWHEGSEGIVDRNGCSAFGWAVDPDDPDRDLQVRILSDGTQVTETTANLAREDLVTECPGGTCGFGVDLWGLVPTGVEHQITAQAYDVETDTWVDLSGTPKLLTAYGYPDGFHDFEEGTQPCDRCTAGGWAYDPDAPERDVQVQVLSDGAVVATTSASEYRADLESACPGGTCSFNLSLWEAISADEAHVITVQAWDEETGAWMNLEATPKSLTCQSPPPPAPIIKVSTSNDYLRADNFTPDALVTFTVYASQGSSEVVLGISRYADASGHVFIDGWEHDADLVPGNYVVATDEINTKDLVLEDLTVDVFDPALDLVAGTASPGRSIWVVVGNDVVGYPAGMAVYADDGGAWTADFATVPFDITEDMWAGAEVSDEDGDATVYHAGPPPPLNPHFTAFPEQEAVEGWDWPLDATVHLTIDDPGTEASADLEQDGTVILAPWGSAQHWVWFDFAGTYDMKPGDVVTLSDGVTTRTHTVRNLAITDVDEAANTVSGTADVGAVVHAWVHEHGETEMELLVEDGTWLADFGGSGFDLEPGMGGRSEIRDEAGNSTAVDWYIPNPYFKAFPEWDYVECWEWPHGAEVHLTIDDPGTGTSPDYEDYGTVEVSSWDPNTWWVSFNFAGAYDMKSGDVVTLSDGVTTRTHTVRNLAVTAMDEIAETVSGTADAGEVVYIWPHEAGQYEQQPTADGEGIWVANFGEAGLDLAPGMGGQAEVRDEQGNATAVQWYIPNPRFTAFPEWDYIEGSEWPLSETVHLTIDDPATPSAPDYEQDAVVEILPDQDPNWPLQFSFGDVYDMKAGDVVTLSNGAATRTHTVRNLAVTAVDEAADTLSGTADAGAEVYVWPHATGEQVLVTADAEGVWQADFTDVFDLVPGEGGRSEIRDEAGNATAVDWQVPNPHFTAFLEQEAVEGWDWPLGATVHLTIDDPGTEASPDLEQDGTVILAPWGSGQHWVWLDFAGAYDMKPGDVVTLSDGTTARTHTVRNLAITEVNKAANIVGGTGDSGAVVYTWVHEHGETEMQVRVKDGEWLAKFRTIGFDLVPGMGGRAEIRDELGNTTAVDWWLPNPYIEADAWHDRYSLADWPAGEPVDVTINDPSTKGIEYETTFVPDGSSTWYDFYPDIDLEPGFVISVRGGGVYKVLVISTLSADPVAPGAETVSGLATPDRTFRMRTDGDHFTNPVEQDVTAGPDGSWSASFDGLALEWYTGGEMWEADDDGDVTYARWHVHREVVEVWMPCNEIRAYDWPRDAELTFIVDDPNTPGSPDYTTTVATEPVWWMDGTGAVASLGEAFTLAPGMVVTVTDGLTEKSTVIQDVAITSADPATDCVYGYAPAGANLEIRSWEDSPVFRFFTAGGDGSWMVDYQVPSDNGVTVDLNPGDVVTLFMREADKDSTVYEYTVPTE